MVDKYVYQGVWVNLHKVGFNLVEGLEYHRNIRICGYVDVGNRNCVLVLYSGFRFGISRDKEYTHKIDGVKSTNKIKIHVSIVQ